VHFVERYGLRSHAERRGAPSLIAEYSKISGRIELVRKAEPELGEQLRARWRAVPIDESSQVSGGPARAPEPVTLLIDDTEFSAHGSSYRGLGIVTLPQTEWVRQKLKELAVLFLLDSTMPESARDRVRQHGIHFVDLPEDFRARAIALVARTTRLRAHITYAKKLGHKGDQLDALLAASLRYRMRDQRGRIVTVMLEQGEYVTSKTAPSVIETAVQGLDERERPLRIEDVRVLSKLQEPCLALPDIALGAWRNYAASNEVSRMNRAERDRLLFAMLRPKVATIFDATHSQLYTSGRPFEPFPVPS